MISIPCKTATRQSALATKSAFTPFASVVALVVALLLPCSAYSQDDDSRMTNCLQEQVVLAINNDRTVADLRETCERLITAAANPVQENPTLQSSAHHSADTETEKVIEETSIVASTPDVNVRSSAAPQGFFRPYKQNYIIVGAMRNRDDTPAFSGNNFDMKFELGMMFSLIPSPNNSSGALPLHFGYSQLSWWDIGEESAPFQELNYNPEIFYDFAGPERISTPDLTRLRNLLYIDRIGLEHQSNGLNEELSRSWDRAYIQREFVFSEVLSFDVKLWKVLKHDRFNEDITDYLGNLQITTQINLNNFAEIDLKTLKGHKTGKISYQLDLTLPMSNWVNSKFFLSYYDGYGEGLINYNIHSKSLRAGFHFPLHTLGL